MFSSLGQRNRGGKVLKLRLTNNLLPFSLDHQNLMRSNFLLCVAVLLLFGVLPDVVKAQFLYTVNDDGTITVTVYTGPPTNAITIPDTVDGLTVTGIGHNLLNGASTLVTVTLPESVASIGSGAFGNCAGLTNADIPAGVTNIGNDAFGGCSSLPSVTISGNGTGIGNGAFAFCSSLTNVTLGTGVSSIGIQAFEQCSGLTSIAIGNGVTNIGILAFEFCSGLTNVTIGSGVTSIGMDVFNGCTGLVRVVMSESIASIENSAFYNNSSLRNITVPTNVTNIADYAFGECANLTGVYFRGNAPAGAGTYAFFDDSNATAYYLPGTTGWQDFAAQTGVPVLLWNPDAQTSDGSFGVGTFGFGFNITGTANIPVVVEATSNLSSATWSVLQSGALTNGSIYFNDCQWTNYPSRFYRIRSP
jgi:hypothetical protein